MPFTPLHMGPGMLLKALLQGAFSLIVFGWCQVLMDIQPLVVMITGEGHLHGFSHTLVGSTGIAILAAISGKLLFEAVLRFDWLQARKTDIALFELNRRLGWPVTITSALIGAYSHVLIDAVMHMDLFPFFPFNYRNPFLYLVTVHVLHYLCIGAGVVGLAIYLFVRRQQLKPA